jgi:ABC-type cobalt transport system, ATPase component
VCRGTFHLRATGTFSEGIHLVRGPIGCGKSTLALLLAGLLTPTHGEVEREEILRTGLLMQFPEYQVTSRTLTEEVESWGASVEPVLQEVDLWDRRESDPLALSRGELKRLLLASLLHMGPDLLLLDEPFGGMDCRERGDMIDRISESGARITILFSHDQGRLPRLDHLWKMEGGSLIDTGVVPTASSEGLSSSRDRGVNAGDGIPIPPDTPSQTGRRV